MTDEHKIEDMALMAGEARQHLDDLRNSGSRSQEQWGKRVRELDNVVNIAVRNRWTRREFV
jgi:hypothetical protein